MHGTSRRQPELKRQHNARCGSLERSGRAMLTVANAAEERRLTARPCAAPCLARDAIHCGFRTPLGGAATEPNRASRAWLS